MILRRKSRTASSIQKRAPVAVGVLLVMLISIFGVQEVLAGPGAGGGGGAQSSNSGQGGTGSSSNSQSQSQGGNQSGSSPSLGGTVLAYDYVKAAGDQIASDLIGLKKNGLQIDTVLITTTPPNQAGSLATYFFLRKFYTDLISKYDDAEAQLKKVKSNAPLIPTETAGDLASAFSTLVGLFGTTTTFTSGTDNADPMALVPNICSTLLGNNKKGSSDNITPIYVDLSLDSSFITDSNSLASILQTATDRRLDSTAYINAGLNQKNPAILSDVTNIMACNAMYDNFSTNLSAASVGGMLNLDYIQTKLRQPNCCLLFVTNSYVIPEMRVKSNPVLNIFTDGPRLSFVGGGGVAYFLYDSNMTIIKAGRFDGYVGYKKYHYQWFPWLQHIKTDLDVPN